MYVCVCIFCPPPPPLVVQCSKIPRHILHWIILAWAVCGYRIYAIVVVVQVVNQSSGRRTLRFSKYDETMMITAALLLGLEAVPLQDRLSGLGNHVLPVFRL